MDWNAKFATGVISYFSNHSVEKGTWTKEVATLHLLLPIDGYNWRCLRDQTVQVAVSEGHLTHLQLQSKDARQAAEDFGNLLDEALFEHAHETLSGVIVTGWHSASADKPPLDKSRITIDVALGMRSQR